MAFLDRILSGKYPKLESLWQREFARLADAAFSIDVPDPDFSDVDEYEPSRETRLQGEVDRLTALVEEAASRLESMRCQLDVVKAERNALQGRLDAARDVLAGR